MRTLREKQSKRSIEDMQPKVQEKSDDDDDDDSVVVQSVKRLKSIRVPKAPMRKLYDYQEKAKSLMNQMEFNFTNSAESGQKINVGVLGSDTGRGKTFIILSLVFGSPRILYTDQDYVTMMEECTPLPTDLCKLSASYMHVPSDWDLTHRMNVSKSDRLFYCGTVEEPSEELSKSKTILPLSIVVCPHVLMKNPWLDELEKSFPEQVPLVFGGARSVELTVDWLSGQSLIGEGKGKNSRLSALCSSRSAYARSTFTTGDVTSDAVTKGTLLLCNSNKYPELTKFLNQNRIKVQRVIYDEATGGHLPACKSIDAYYYWAMTATWTELVSIPNSGFLKERFSRLSPRQIMSIMVNVNTCGDNRHDEALNFKPYLNHVISCKAEPVQKIIGSCYPHSKLTDFVNEGLFDYCKTYLRKRIASNKHCHWLKHGDTENEFKGKADAPSRSYLSVYSILELQLLNIGLNGSIAEATCWHRTKMLLEKIFAARICLRCNTELCSSTDTKSTAGYRTKCCGVNYCSDCAIGSDTNPAVAFRCTLCTQYYSKTVKFLPNGTNGTNGTDTDGFLSGVDLLARCEREIQKNGGHWVYADERDTDNALFGKQKTKRKSTAMLRREVMREAQVELEGRALTYVSRECNFINPDELSKPQAAMKIIQHYRDAFRRSNAPMILLFVNSTKTAMLLTKMLKAADIQYKHLNGSGSRIAKLVSGATDKVAEAPLVLLISSQNGTDRGVNIPLADVQIIYDAKDRQTTIQKVARTQRHGRSLDADPLHVYELRYSKLST
jgi:hypothetical protein